jgi:molybdopterin-guanine dinucleotide biosynthesis protein A
VVGILVRLGGPVVVVRPSGRALPRLPHGAEIVDDRHVERGPLRGLATGLQALAGRVEVAYASATDVPLLHPAFVHHVCGRIGPNHDIAAPDVDGPQSLAAELVARGETSLDALLEAARVRWLPEDELRGVDAELRSLWNLNESGNFRRARAEPLPRVIVEIDAGVEAKGLRSRIVGAATLRQAASACGVPLGLRASALVNREVETDDPEVPLVDGDEVLFIQRRAT